MSENDNQKCLTDPTDEDLRTVRGQALAMATLCDVALSSRERPVGASCSRSEARVAVARYLAGLRNDNGPSVQPGPSHEEPLGPSAGRPASDAITVEDRR